MGALLQDVMSGLAAGSIYGALALALVFVFRSTGVVNFAQGEMAMISTYISLSFYNLGVPLLAAVVLSMACSFLIGITVERTLIRPVAGRTAHAASIVTVGLFLAANGIAGYVWGVEPRGFPSLFSRESVGLGGARIAVADLGALAVLVVLVFLLFLLFEKTRVGLMMRAAASQPASARMAGAPVSNLLMSGWGISAAVGAVAGALIAPAVFVSPGMMGPVFIYALAAAALGGLSSPLGAVLGGWIIGVAEAVIAPRVDFIGSQLAILIPLTIIFLVLLLRPAGLLGVQEVKRV
ncbi:MAG: branched-chain amino acid transporter permease [Blastococcus sp.]|jgi:branched-chain amino acid transport system permease protein|nr:branched-chain amino acid transporter permease [Blastococcus sp.]